MEENDKNNLVTLVLGLVFIALLGLVLSWLVQEVLRLAHQAH